MNCDEFVGKQIFKEFKPEHNHPLASANEVHFICSHRKVTGADFVQAKANVGVKTCQFMDYMTNQVNRSQNLRFTHKDMQKTLDVFTRAVVRDLD